MSRYFFIQSSDPLTDRSTDNQFSLIAQLAHKGNDVSLFLVQNGVAPAAIQMEYPAFDSLLDKGVKIYADTFSLQQREIDTSQLKKNIEGAELNLIIQAMLNGEKVIWSQE